MRLQIVRSQAISAALTRYVRRRDRRDNPGYAFTVRLTAARFLIEDSHRTIVGGFRILM